ncbi:MAG: Fic family protein [archaeon]
MGNDRRFCLFDQGLLDQIEDRKGVLSNVHTFSLSNHKKRCLNLEKELARHSVNLELEGFNSQKSKTKERRRSEKNLKHALSWAREELNKNPELSLNFLENVGSLIDPLTNKDGFRSYNVRVTGSLIPQTSLEKLPRELNTFLIRNKYLRTPFEKAVHAHFHIARIHPFGDGNGRTARLVQDLILGKNGYCPIIIYNKEREEYISLIRKAELSRHIAEGNLSTEEFKKLQGVKERLLVTPQGYEREVYIKEFLTVSRKLMTPEQAEFYNFLALKEKNVLDAELRKVYENGMSNRNLRKIN